MLLIMLEIGKIRRFSFTLYGYLLLFRRATNVQLWFEDLLVVYLKRAERRN